MNYFSRQRTCERRDQSYGCEGESAWHAKGSVFNPNREREEGRERWGRQTKGRILITFAFLRRQRVDNTGASIFSSVLRFVSERLRSKRTWLLEGRLISTLFQSFPLHFLQKKANYIPDRPHVSSDWPLMLLPNFTTISQHRKILTFKL